MGRLFSLTLEEYVLFKTLLNEIEQNINVLRNKQNVNDDEKIEEEAFEIGLHIIWEIKEILAYLEHKITTFNVLRPSTDKEAKDPTLGSHSFDHLYNKFGEENCQEFLLLIVQKFEDNVDKFHKDILDISSHQKYKVDHSKGEEPTQDGSK